MVYSIYVNRTLLAQADSYTEVMDVLQSFQYIPNASIWEVNVIREKEDEKELKLDLANCDSDYAE